jgi:hypothetical protein
VALQYRYSPLLWASTVIDAVRNIKRQIALVNAFMRTSKEVKHTDLFLIVPEITIEGVAMKKFSCYWHITSRTQTGL